jgi:hypothetical protein
MRQMIALIALIFCMAFPLAAQAAGSMEGMDMSMPGHVMAAPATTPTAPAGPVPTIVIAPRLEEGKRVLGATVTLEGKPLVGAKVGFFVQRTFGALDIGHDETLDDGVAVAKFPEGLPGGTVGKLHIIARVTGTARYAAASSEITVPSDIVVVPDSDPFPRAIWAPHAPIPLILTLTFALGGVWTTYTFVLLQLRALRKAGNP